MDRDTNENFFRRWARRKAENDAAHSEAPTDSIVDTTASRDSDLSALPTLADVGALTPDSDFSRYLAPRLDRAVHRAAMKTLFSDPHFNRMDGLDIYIDDYNVLSPVSAVMLAGFAHAKSTLDPRPAWLSLSKKETTLDELDPAGDPAPGNAPAPLVTDIDDTGDDTVTAEIGVVVDEPPATSSSACALSRAHTDLSDLTHDD